MQFHTQFLEKKKLYSIEAYTFTFVTLLAVKFSFLRNITQILGNGGFL